MIFRVIVGVIFLKKKDELEDKVVKLIKESKNENIQLKFLRLDNAGEDYALEKECKQQNLAVRFEYSGTGTTQRNGKVERIFIHCMVEFEQY
jgi:hypothetical protein